MFAKTAIISFFLVALVCIAQASPIPEDSSAKEKRALVYSAETYHAPVISHAPLVASAPVYTHAAPVIAHAPIAHGATSYSSFTINHPTVVAHAPIIAAHAAPLYTAHAPLYASYYHH